MTRAKNGKALALAALILLAQALGAPRAGAGEPAQLTVAGGCFWCVEADFESLPGVLEAVSGYAGGDVPNPSYKAVTAGGTGHVEAVRITFDPDRISRAQLLDLFFRSVDPTDPGGQFCDRGDSYRSAIFVSDPGEKTLAEAARARAAAALGQPIVTPIIEGATFYPAEEYHQDYARGRRIVLTRFGPRRQSVAYKLYRQACGRDARLRALWGSAAFLPGTTD